LDYSVVWLLLSLSACNFRFSFRHWQKHAKIRPLTNIFPVSTGKNFRFSVFVEILPFISAEPEVLIATYRSFPYAGPTMMKKVTYRHSDALTIERDAGSAIACIDFPNTTRRPPSLRALTANPDAKNGHYRRAL